MKCRICETDEAVMKHHKNPRCYGGGETIKCCEDCGNQIHMLFTNKELSKIPFNKLIHTKEMKTYVEWKKKHPGKHSYRASKKIREYDRNHRKK